ncbi:putative mRNA-splicing protein [Trichinella spiralis]|uniref:mRNA-splicing protein n=1 Tax=Trichinella spiralis TaxID=6334 RepID=A0ABR3KAB0_TRISP
MELLPLHCCTATISEVSCAVNLFRSTRGHCFTCRHFFQCRRQVNFAHCSAFVNCLLMRFDVVMSASGDRWSEQLKR